MCVCVVCVGDKARERETKREVDRDEELESAKKDWDLTVRVRKDRDLTVRVSEKGRGREDCLDSNDALSKKRTF